MSDKVWVAYNDYGDLVAMTYSLWSLIERVRMLGYEEADLLIGMVTA